MAWRYGKAGGGGAPVLSAATASTDGNDHAFIGVSTNTGSGTLFYDGSTNCAANPTAAQVKAGTTPGHVVNGSQSVSSSGVQSANPGSLSPVTAYCFYFVQTTSGDSNIVNSSSFTTNGTLSWSISRTAAYLANPSVAAFDTVIASVNTELTNCLAPPSNITVSQNLDYGAISGFAVTFASASDNSYTSAIKAALIALPGKNSIQTALFASPPASDPTGLGDTYYLTNAESLAIGLPRFGSQPDFTTEFSNGATWDTTTNCSGVGTCLASVTEHEFTEGLGRKSGIDSGGGIAGLMEFSSYSGTGVRNVTTTGTRYPSSDGGTTNLISACTLNQGAGDTGDWTDGSCTDAFTADYSGAKPPMSVQDIKDMTVQGWPLTHSCRITAGL